jgi:hypothetical protein
MHRRYGALEGRIYEDMDHVLRGNWQRLRPSVRRLLRAAAGTAAAPLLERSLRALVWACAQARATAPAQVPCSVLANLLFWDSLARTADAARFACIIAG